jgi:A repeated domain in UCH-protein
MLVSSLENGPEDELLLQIVRQEIEATLASIRSPHGYLSIPDESIVPHFESATPALEAFLAGQYDRRTANSTVAADAEFSLLGGVPDMADNVIVWIYRLLVNEQPQNHSGWLDALEKIAKASKSEELQTEVAIEHSHGVFGFTDVTRAYQHFDIADPQNVDDDLILGLYDVKVRYRSNFSFYYILPCYVCLRGRDYLRHFHR